MSKKPDFLQPAAGNRSAITGQVIACSVAIAIMGLGVWTLMGRTAPYHPDTSFEDVTRGDTPTLGALDN